MRKEGMEDKSVNLYHHPGAPRKPEGRLSSSLGRVKAKTVSLSIQGCWLVTVHWQNYVMHRHGTCDLLKDTPKQRGWSQTGFPLLCPLITYKWKECARPSEANNIGILAWSPSTSPSLAAGSYSKGLCLSELHRVTGNVKWDTVGKLPST